MLVYRGLNTSQSPAPGWFYHPDIEFARQFTQSGQFKEIAKADIDPAKVMTLNPMPYGGDPDEIDEAVAKARSGGFDAFWVDEGSEKPSIFILKRAIANKSMKVLGRCTDKDGDSLLESRLGIGMATTSSSICLPINAGKKKRKSDWQPWMTPINVMKQINEAVLKENCDDEEDGDDDTLPDFLKD